VTTLGCFLYDKESYLPKIEHLSQKVKAHSLADVMFHLTISTQQHLDEIPQYVHQYGIRSFKIYMSGVPGIIPDIDDGFMTRVYEKLVETRQRCTVCIHAENASLVRWATEEIMAKDGMRTSVQEWSETHPPIAEEEAIRRAALLTKEFEGVFTYFVHVSTKEGIRAISQIKHDSPHVFAETTSPYLLFSIEKAKGNIPKWLPPLRNKESVETLWEMLKKGRIDSLGTDSVPMSREIKGLERSVWEAMPNAPSMEFHLPGLLTEGVAHRKIPMATLLDLMTRRPAEIFGIFPQKGSLLPGADADLVVVDMDRWHRVSRDRIKSSTPFSLYEDHVLTGWPVIVIKGGRLIIKDGNWVADPPPSQVLMKLGNDA
jgi:dihydropyrimidinase